MRRHVVPSSLVACAALAFPFSAHASKYSGGDVILAFVGSVLIELLVPLVVVIGLAILIVRSKNRARYAALLILVVAAPFVLAAYSRYARLAEFDRLCASLKDEEAALAAPVRTEAIEIQTSNYSGAGVEKFLPSVGWDGLLEMPARDGPRFERWVGALSEETDELASRVVLRQENAPAATLGAFAIVKESYVLIDKQTGMELMRRDIYIGRRSPESFLEIFVPALRRSPSNQICSSTDRATGYVEGGEFWKRLVREIIVGRVVVDRAAVEARKSAIREARRRR